MSRTSRLIACYAMIALGLLPVGCGGSDDEADRLGVGAECDPTDDLCDEETAQVCLTQFTGGYCGIVGCASDLDCPEASGCVMHDDGANYCFRVCSDKSECNVNRSVDNEANCSSNVTFVDGAQGRKACVPPSSGI